MENLLQRAVVDHYRGYFGDFPWVCALPQHHPHHCKACLKLYTRPDGLRVASLVCGPQSVEFVYLVRPAHLLDREYWISRSFELNDPGFPGCLDVLLRRFLDDYVPCGASNSGPADSLNRGHP